MRVAEYAARYCIRANVPVSTVPYLQSVIPANRLRFLEGMCRNILRRLPGNILEVGVYRGGSLVRLAEAVKDLCPDFRVIGIDTFSGHPYTDGHPVHPVGKYSDVDLNILKAKLEEQGLSRWVTLIQGRVEDVFPSLGFSEISLAHIDCDLYVPIRYCARVVPPLPRKTGILYFDDYGHEHCPGATRAINECFDHRFLREVCMPEDGTCWSCYLDPSSIKTSLNSEGAPDEP